MKMTGEQRIAAPREKVWAALNDPEVLRQCIPGCQSLEKEGNDKLKAVAEIKIGPIGARFNGLVTLSELDPPNGYTITGQGNGGIAGTAKGGAKVRLTDAGGGATLLSYDVDAEVGGRLAQLGGPIIDATAKQLAGKFFEKFGGIVSGTAVAAPSGAAAASTSSAQAAPAAAAGPVLATGSVARAPYPAVTPASFPWSWVAASVIAIVAGFLLGRSEAADWSVVAVAVLAVVVAAAGYETGRRGAAR